MNITRLLILSIISNVLAGCSLISDRQGDCRDNNLLRATRSVLQLPDNEEMTAALSVTRDGVVEEYLLAIHTYKEGFRGALLSPQGLPVATLDYSPEKRDISTQASAGHLLPPAALGQYLELIYRDDASLGRELLAGWCFETVSEPLGQERRIQKNCPSTHANDKDQVAGSEIAYSIRYGGSAPWYDRIELQDYARVQLLTVRILEISNALPE